MAKRIPFILFLALCFSFSVISCADTTETASVSFIISEESLQTLFKDNPFTPENKKTNATTNNNVRSALSLSDDENFTLNLSVSGDDFAINEIFNIRPTPPHQTFSIDELPSEIPVSIDISIKWRDILYYIQKQKKKIILSAGENIVDVAIKKAFTENDSFGTITANAENTEQGTQNKISEQTILETGFSLSSNFNPEKYEWFINGKKLSWTEKEGNRFSPEELENISKPGTNSLVCIFGPISGTELSENGIENVYYAAKTDFILSDEIPDSKEKDEPEEPHQDEEKKDEPDNPKPSETDKKDEPENPAKTDEKLSQLSGNFVISLGDDITVTFLCSEGYDPSTGQTEQIDYLSSSKQSFFTIKIYQNGNQVVVKNAKAVLYDGGTEYSGIPANPFTYKTSENGEEILMTEEKLINDLSIFNYVYEFSLTSTTLTFVMKEYRNSETQEISQNNGDIAIQITDVNISTPYYQLVLSFTYNGKTYQATFDLPVKQ